nr:bile salt-activated lipase-like [Aegilops tauschii subsp. strangulata]
MAPKKKSGAPAHPSTSKAPPPAASNAAGDTEAHKDVDAAVDVVGACGAITTPPAADAGARNTGGEQHQQRPDGHAPQGMDEGVIPSAPLPPADGHSRSNGAQSGANCRPPAAPTMGATAACAPPPGRVDQIAVPN